MWKKFAPAVALLPALTLMGCAGVGVVATADPATKLHDAEVLYDQQGRPLIAERLIREAMDIYEKRGDTLGLADAYREYGFFFRSGSVSGRSSEHYRQHGFLDATATFDTRYRKSIEYFEKARAIYDANGKLDVSTNVSLNMGLTYVLMEDTSAACGEFQRSLASSEQSLRQNPGARLNLPQGFASYVDYVVDLKKQYGCS